MVRVVADMEGMTRVCASEDWQGTLVIIAQELIIVS